MPPMRSPRSPRRARSASGSPMRVAALARFEGLKRRLETVGDGRRRHRDRRFRAQSRQDRRDAGDAARAAGPAADPVPAARLRPADQDGRGAGRELRRRPRARTTGSICPTRSIRAARSNGRAAADWLAEQVASAAARPSISPSARRSARRCSPRRATGDRIVIMGARDDTLERIRARSWSSGSAAELIRASASNGMAKPGTVIGWKLAADERERAARALPAALRQRHRRPCHAARRTRQRTPLPREVRSADRRPRR